MATHEKSIKFWLCHVIQTKLLPLPNEEKHSKKSILFQFEKGFKIIYYCNWNWLVVKPLIVSQ